MYAIVEYKGKQYKAEKDAVITVDKISDVKEGDTLTIDNVLLVTVEVGNTFKSKKVLVFKYKSKKDYHRLIGHREEYTDLKVKDVIFA